MKKLLIFLFLLNIKTIMAFTIVGHRGAAGIEPENTLRSFQKALDTNSKMIELDVYVCASGEVVVIHDDTVDRTTNGHGNVKDLTLEQLQALDAGKNEKIPLLDEVIELVNRKIPINIELKGPGTAKPVADIIKKYKSREWCWCDFVVSSFNHYAVLEFKKYCSQVDTGVIFQGIPIGLANIALEANAKYIMLSYESITEKFVKDAHDKNIKIFAYTVNTQKLADELRDLGVDGIFTNYPDNIS